MHCVRSELFRSVEKEGCERRTRSMKKIDHAYGGRIESQALLVGKAFLCVLELLRMGTGEKWSLETERVAALPLT
jgi:hypothetical protein